MREAKARVDSVEFDYWKAYFELCPDSADRIDAAAAMITSSIFRAAGVDAKMADFLPDYAARFREPEDLPTDEQMTASINAVFGAIQQRAQIHAAVQKADAT